MPHFEMIPSGNNLKWKKKDFHNFQKFFLHLTEVKKKWILIKVWNDRWEIFFYAQLLFRNVEIGLNNSVADPGFPQGGDTIPPGVVGGAQTYDFTNFSQNMHEIE